MPKFCSKMVPKIRTIEQKDNQKNEGLDVFERIANEKDFFSSVIIGG